MADPRAPCFHWNVCFVDAVGIHHHHFSCYMGLFPQSGVRHLFNSAAFGFSNLVTFQLSSQFSFFPFGRFYVVSYHLHPLYFCWPFSQLCFLMFSFCWLVTFLKENGIKEKNYGLSVSLTQHVLHEWAHIILSVFHETQAFWLLLYMFKWFSQSHQDSTRVVLGKLRSFGEIKNKEDSREAAGWTNTFNLTPSQNLTKTAANGPWFVCFMYKSTLTEVLFCIVV